MNPTFARADLEGRATLVGCAIFERADLEGRATVAARADLEGRATFVGRATLVVCATFAIPRHALLEHSQPFPSQWISDLPHGLIAAE